MKFKIILGVLLAFAIASCSPSGNQKQNSEKHEEHDGHKHGEDSKNHEEHDGHDHSKDSVKHEEHN